MASDRHPRGFDSDPPIESGRVQGLPQGVPSSLFKAYAPDSPARVIRYGPSQLGWNFLRLGRSYSQIIFLTPGPRVGMLEA